MDESSKAKDLVEAVDNNNNIGTAELDLLVKSYSDTDGKLKSEIFEKHMLLVRALKNIGVLCLSCRKNSVLMWSHYADEHKGLTIGFEIDENVPCNPVEYKSSLPKRDLSYFFSKKRSNADGFIDITFTKHEDWIYEKEYRICVSGGNRLSSIPGKIIEINFGCKMPKDSKKTLSKLVAHIPGGKSIQLYSAKKDGSLNLKFEALN